MFFFLNLYSYFYRAIAFAVSKKLLRSCGRRQEETDGKVAYIYIYI